MAVRPFSDARVLIVEDEFILGWGIERALYAAGCAAVKLTTLSAEAMRELRYWTPDAAVLDLRMRDGTSSVVVADELARLGAPFMFVTGQGRDAVPERHRERPFLSKPCPPETVVETLRQVMEDDMPKGNNDPDPNIERQIRQPGPASPPIPQGPAPAGYGQGGQPPHEYPGQPPATPPPEGQPARHPSGPRRKQR
jgi:DNA-binding NtrC family response regulator